MIGMVHDTIMTFLNRCVRAISDDDRRMYFNYRVKLMVKINKKLLVNQDGEICKEALLNIVRDVSRRELKGTPELALIISNMESYYIEALREVMRKSNTKRLTHAV